MRKIYKERGKANDHHTERWKYQRVLRPKSIIEIAADISEGLARMACAGEVNGEVEDLRTVIDKDCNLSILTFNDEGGKAAFRHTTSHIMAQAIKRLYPDTKLGHRTVHRRRILLRCRQRDSAHQRRP